MNSTYDKGYGDALEKLGFSIGKEASIAGRIGRFAGRAKGLFKRNISKPSYVESVVNPGRARAATKAVPTGAASSVGSGAKAAPAAPAAASAAAEAKPGLLGRFGGKALKYGLPAGALVGGVAAMRASNKPQAQPQYQGGMYASQQYGETPNYY